MVGNLGKTTNNPRDVTGQQVQAERDSMWGPIPGEVVSFDAVNGTATIRPLYKPRHNGVPVDMPDLYEVPVDMPRTANGGMSFPVPAGTKVMLTPQMRSMDDYEEGGEGDAYDARSFHLSNMRASLSGGDRHSDPLPNADADNIHLRFNQDGSFGLKGSPDGKFQLTGAEGEIFDIMAAAIEKDAEGFQLLSTEPELIHTASYATIATELSELAAKIRGMMI